MRIKLIDPETGNTVLATEAGADVLIERGFELADDAEPDAEPETEGE